MKRREVVRWGIQSNSISDLENGLVFWYRSENATWVLVCDKEQATPMDIKQAVTLMQMNDILNPNRVFVMEFVS